MRLRFTDIYAKKEIFVSFIENGSVSSSAEHINEESHFVESSKYAYDLLLEDDEISSIDSISIVLNEDNEIGCWSKEGCDLTSYAQNCYFIGQVDLIQFSVNIIYNDGSFEQRVSEYFLCKYKEPEDYQNIHKIITSVLDFDDMHIVAHMFALTSSQASSSSSLLRGALLPNSYKTIRTIIKIVTEICACYRIHLPYFQRKAHHRVTADRAVVPIDKVRQVSASSVYWLAQTPEAISKASLGKGCPSLPNNRTPLFLESHIENRSYDVYENRVCCAFLTKVLSFIQKLDYEFSESKKNAENFLRKYTKFEDIKAPILVLKHQLIKIQVPFSEQIRLLRSELFNLKTQYDKILKCQYAELTSLPKPTKVFLNNPVYHAFFKLILIWYKDGEFEQAGEDRIFKVKRATELFEIYCLQQILMEFKAHGFNIVESFVYQYPLFSSCPNSKKTHIVANTYKLCKDGIKVTLYYEPRIYNCLPNGDYGDTMPNGLELYRVDYSSKNNYWEPDFVLKIEDKDKTYYSILDAKYAFSKNIAPRSVKDSRYYLDGHLPAIIEKYSTYTAAFNHANICMVWTLQGRVDQLCKLTRFGSAREISPKFLPTISYGNCPVNTNDKMSTIRVLWNELCSMIPCMRGYTNVIDEPSDVVQKCQPSQASKTEVDSTAPTEIAASVSTTTHTDQIEAKYTPEEKRNLQKELWNSCQQYVKSKEALRKRFCAITSTTYSSSYTLYKFSKKSKAKITIQAFCDSHKVSVIYNLPSIHRGLQREIYKKLYNAKDKLLAEVTSINHAYSDMTPQWIEENNELSLSLMIGFDFDNISVDLSAGIIDAAFALIGCIDRYR